jgi:hypothetical protein
VASSALGTGFVRSAADCTPALTLAVCRLAQLAARARSVLDSLSFRRRGIYDKTKLIFGGFEITRRRFPPSGCFARASFSKGWPSVRNAFHSSMKFVRSSVCIAVGRPQAANLLPNGRCSLAKSDLQIRRTIGKRTDQERWNPIRDAARIQRLFLLFGAPSVWCHTANHTLSVE